MNAVQRAGWSAIVTAIACVVGLWATLGSAAGQGEAKKSTKYPQQVLIIRHAEKTGDKTDLHLSKPGLERAEVLYQLFVASKNRPDPFPTPDFIFAASNSKNSHRPLETVEPLAKKLKLAINNKYSSKLPAVGNEEEGMIGLRNEIFGETKYFGKTILISWRHGTIGELAKTLRATKVPAKWEDGVFDRVWQIRYDDAGNATFLDLPQLLMPADATK